MQSAIIESRTAVEKKQYVIEGLSDEITWLLKREKTARAEAIKEFAENLKSALLGWDSDAKDEDIEWTIDNLVKEMVGES